ncbi:MAG: hypothetical protein P1T08_00480 [Acidimicrobiia bacterium]|nr:hypothetical protein [Acidimicrobiia bacterium]
MNGVYGLSLVIGLVALVAWILIGGLSESNSARPVHPDERFGATGRGVVGGLTAFGIGGLSASYGGWPTAAAIAAALVAALVFAAYAYRYDPGSERDAD